MTAKSKKIKTGENTTETRRARRNVTVYAATVILSAAKDLV